MWRHQTLKRHVCQLEHVFWATKCANRTKIDRGWPRKRKKRKKVGEESHKIVIFHHHVEVPFRTRSAPTFVSLYSRLPSFVPNIHCYFHAERWKKEFPFRKQAAYKTVLRATALACDSTDIYTQCKLDTRWQQMHGSNCWRDIFLQPNAWQKTEQMIQVFSAQQVSGNITFGP